MKQRKDNAPTEPTTEETTPKEHVSTPSYNPPLSDEDRMQLAELISLCTNLQEKVLDLEKAKTASSTKAYAILQTKPTELAQLATKVPFGRMVFTAERSQLSLFRGFLLKVICGVQPHRFVDLRRQGLPSGMSLWNRILIIIRGWQGLSSG
ncbi:hypothetical protein Tco_1246353 [Tanacetum coccineum]